MAHSSGGIFGHGVAKMTQNNCERDLAENVKMVQLVFPFELGHFGILMHIHTGRFQT